MSYCIIPGCKNRKARKNYEQIEKETANKSCISFHCFPKDIERKKKWLEVLNLENYNPPKTGAVCSEHFKKEDYNVGHSLRSLKRNAVLFLLTQIDSIKVEVVPTLIEENIHNDETVTTNTERTSFHTDKNTKTEVEMKYQDRGTSMSPERIFNSPNKNRLRKIHKKEIEHLKNKLYTASFQIKKAWKTMESLKTVLQELQRRNLVWLQESDILKNLDQGTKDIIKREIRKKNEMPVSNKYMVALRQFALSLHFYSPKAYKYVRSKFYNSLPHPKTISIWYRSVNGEPGIITEALEAIKRYATAVPYKLISALMFDEMAISREEMRVLTPLFSVIPVMCCTMRPMPAKTRNLRRSVSR